MKILTVRVSPSPTSVLINFESTLNLMSCFFTLVARLIAAILCSEGLRSPRSKIILLGVSDRALAAASSISLQTLVTCNGSMITASLSAAAQ